MANRNSTASDRSKRWSMPALQALPETRSDRTSTAAGPPPDKQLPARPNRNTRGSINGTSYGKSDFGVPTAPTMSTSDRRASRRISRISKLSDVSEVESERTRSRNMSTSVIDDDMGRGNRRMSRRMSVADDLAADSERRRSRRMSMMSTNSSINRFSMMSRANNDWRQEPEEAEKPRNWEDSLKKPSNWNDQKKNVNTAICSIIVFAYTMSLTVYGAAIPATVADLNLSGIGATVPYSCFALGLAFGPALSTPFEKAYGRKPVLLSTIPLFALCMIGAGVSKGLIPIAVCRGLAGFFASAGLFVSYTIMSDIWVSLRLSIGLALYLGSMVLGLFAGPIVGGVVIKYESWRWTMWVALFATVILMFGSIGMTESQEDAVKRSIKTPQQIEKEVLERRAKRVTRTPSRLHFRGNFMFGKAFSMLLAAPSLSMATLYVSYVLAVSIAMPVFVPDIFGTLYQFDAEQQNLTFAGAAGGVVVGVLLIIILDHFIHQPRVGAWEDEHDPLPERGEVETTRVGKDHPSWRKGLARVSTRNLGIRDSTASSAEPSRSGSDASSRSMRTHRSRRQSSEHRKSRLQSFSERNINIAIAVTRFLNSQPANQNKKIIVERVMVLLKNTDSFTKISDSLGQLGLDFEEALLAKVITDALEKEKSGAEIGLSRSRSLHQLAAQAALMGGDNNIPETPSEPPSAALPSPTEEKKDDKPLAPPAEWRWLPALAASLLFPGGLLLFAWTAREGVNWIIPCIGLALSGVGACLITFSAITYMMELHEEGDEAIGARAGATMLTFILGAALPLVVKPMFDALGARIGVTIFAAVAAVLGVVPWVLTYRGNKLVPKEAGMSEKA
ncbi:Polyamine transporter-like protein 6 [Elsinoe fawcettii]|nr:Polyamine transporter-like protein 6 [Elsinoe fawcettii]